MASSLNLCSAPTLKKIMSLIKKKMKARDLDNIKLNSSLNSNPVAINTPEVFSRKKKSFKLG